MLAIIGPKINETKYPLIPKLMTTKNRMLDNPIEKVLTIPEIAYSFTYPNDLVKSEIKLYTLKLHLY